MHARAVVTSVCLGGVANLTINCARESCLGMSVASRHVASRGVLSRPSVSFSPKKYVQTKFCFFYFLSDTADPRVSVFFLFLHKISPPDLGALTAGGPVLFLCSLFPFAFRYFFIRCFFFSASLSLSLSLTNIFCFRLNFNFFFLFTE